MVYVLCLLLLLLRRGRVCVENVKMMLLQMPKLKRIDTMPEWSKGWTQVLLAEAAWVQIPQVPIA